MPFLAITSVFCWILETIPTIGLTLGSYNPFLFSCKYFSKLTAVGNAYRPVWLVWAYFWNSLLSYILVKSDVFIPCLNDNDANSFLVKWPIFPWCCLYQAPSDIPSPAVPYLRLNWAPDMLDIIFIEFTRDNVANSLISVTAWFNFAKNSANTLLDVPRLPAIFPSALASAWAWSSVKPNAWSRFLSAATSSSTVRSVLDIAPHIFRISWIIPTNKFLTAPNFWIICEMTIIIPILTNCWKIGTPPISVPSISNNPFNPLTTGPIHANAASP